MNTLKKSLVLSCLALPLLSFAAEPAASDAPPAAKEHSTLELAQAAQNPLTAMISLPFQNNVNLNVGPSNQTQNVLLVQPVFPFELNEDWNLIQRTIAPVTTQPGYITGDGQKTGIGNTQVLAYFSPKKDFNGWYFGASPLLILPASTTNYGSTNWGYGGSAVALTMPGNWVIGVLFTQQWMAANSDSAQVNTTTVQYFANYNIPDTGGWYLSTTPTMTYNKRAAAGNRFNIPVGGGVGKVFHWGKQAMNFRTNIYKNVVKPNANSSDWQIQSQLTFMFPNK